MKSNSTKYRDLIQLAAIVVIIIAINVIGTFIFERFDLTAEKRYSLSPTTIDLVENLDDVVYVKVYLEGDFPAEFQRLRQRVKEMLDEFRAYGKTNIEYEFINPSKASERKERDKLYRQLINKGLKPTTYQMEESGGKSQKTIFPGAIFYYQGREMPVNFLKSRMGEAPIQMIHNSIQDLEYELSNTIRKLTKDSRTRIAFIEGHGELDSLFVADIMQSLGEYYIADRVEINAQLNSLSGYDAIVIAKPDTFIPDKDKFVIDQFIMRGGKALWLIDPVFASMDSLQLQPQTLAFPMDLNIDDQLFKYGVRINTDLVQDRQCAQVPGPTGYVGEQLQWELQDWIYFPLIIPEQKHPVVKNLNGIKTEFVSSIDTVGAKGVKKKVLLNTSRYSRTVPTPSRVSLETLVKPPPPGSFGKSNIPVGVLLEGEFESLFKNRIPPEIAENEDIGFREKSVPTSMIVFSDGDLIKNAIQGSTKRPYPLGFDPYTGQTYGNKTLILNTMNYLCDDKALISVRAKDFKIRLLDKKKVESQRLQWQLINMIAPLLLVVIFGFVQNYLRKRRYGRKAPS